MLYALSDLGEEEVAARAAVGLFPHVGIDPEMLVWMFDVIRRQDKALEGIRGLVASVE